MSDHASTAGQTMGILRERIEQFQLDQPSSELTFTQRLARENGWSHAFALRVVGEYKRFVYLAMTAGHQVTPSDEVDQAWHLHLTYTRSYWEELCGEVLGRPLHHGPTTGGRAESERFEHQYEQTLASYRAAFDEEPPGDIWPPAAVLFSGVERHMRVDTQRYLVIRRPWFARSSRLAGGLAGVGLFGFLPPVFLGEADVPTIVVVLVVVVIAVLIIRAFMGGGGGSGCGGFFGCGGDSGCGGGGCGGGD